MHLARVDADTLRAHRYVVAVDEAGILSYTHCYNYTSYAPFKFQYSTHFFNFLATPTPWLILKQHIILQNHFTILIDCITFSLQETLHTKSNKRNFPHQSQSNSIQKQSATANEIFQKRLSDIFSYIQKRIFNLSMSSHHRNFNKFDS
jgi:hypothetical protein